MAKVKKPKMETKQEVIDYIAKNKDKELPFNEEVWNKAVELTKDKVRKNMELTQTDFEGNTKKRVIPNGTLNPVGKYFQMMALPQYKNAKHVVEDYEEDDTFEIKFENEERNEEVSSWINTFFQGYSKEDKKFLQERLSDYYENYELNEGADKTIVVMVVTDELQVMKLNQARVKGKDVEAQLEKVRKGYLASLESLKALKKQRGTGEEGKNKLTQWIDELEKAGDFKAKKVVYDMDEIGFFLGEFKRSMIEVLRSG